MILAITDENKHFHQLNRDKHLEEREKLTARVRELEGRLAEKDNDAKLLARKLQLEGKSFRNQLHQENLKYREVCQKLDKATSEVARLTARVDVGERRMNGGTFLVRGYQQRNFLFRESHSAQFTTSLAPINNFRASGSSSATPKSPEEIPTHRLEKLPAAESEEMRKRKDASKRDIRKMQEIMKNAESSGMSTTKSISSEDSGGNVNGQDLPEDTEPDVTTRKHEETEEVTEIVKESRAYETEGKDDELTRKFQRLSSKEDVKLNEAILDEICENVIRNGVDTPPERSDEVVPAVVTFQKPKNPPSSKRQNIDQKKKTKLLAALKAIDANESFES
uniref:Lebercilin domain-containing protein n=2 Tax=Lutzomyia longipalpis TaxID=7200 RepID=A0A1B0CN32_LUTLO